MEELVNYIVKQLATNVDAVKIESIENEDGTITIKVTVAEEDMGRVIGKGGRVAQSIRAIVKTASSHTGKKYLVQIGERA